MLFDTFAKLKDLDFVNSDIFAAAYNAGDVDAIRLALENVDYLSIGLNNIIVAEDPELLIVNSSVYRKIPIFFPGYVEKWSLVLRKVSPFRRAC